LILRSAGRVSTVTSISGLPEFTSDVAAPPLGRRPDVVVDFAQRLRDAVRDFAGDRENST
jgi:hypothetical protein